MGALGTAVIGDMSDMSRRAWRIIPVPEIYVMADVILAALVLPDNVSGIVVRPVQNVDRQPLGKYCPCISAFPSLLPEGSLGHV
jgi:hypothetical protein